MVKAQKDQNTQEKILAAARSVFLEQGMAGARMQDIADRAGINKALLHYYYRNKEKLFEMVFLEAASRFFPKVIGIMTSEATLFEKIEMFVHEYISTLVENPYLPMFILHEVNKQPQAFVRQIFGNKKPPVQKLAEHIEREVKAGTIRPIDPTQLIVNMVSLCIFPFVGRPVMQWLFTMNDDGFAKFMEARKMEVTRFIIDSIRK